MAEVATARLDSGATIGLEFGPVVVPSAADVFASVLRGKILSGELSEGVSLPPERALVEQSKLSRATVREALRTLKLQGLILTRPGRGGGSVVARPSAVDVASSLDVYLQGWQLDTAVLLEAREIIEPWCAALAAQRRTDGQLAGLDEHNRRMRAVLHDLPAYLQANLAWHTAVAEASHNELLSTFMHAAGLAVLRQTASEEFNTVEVRTTAVEAHGRVTEAIRTGDAAAAHRRMARHVHCFGEALLRSLGLDEHRLPTSPLSGDGATR